MKKSLPLFAICAFTFVLFSTPAKAQTGCDDSPENPTLVLAGLAGAGYVVNQWRRRVRNRSSWR